MFIIFVLVFPFTLLYERYNATTQEIESIEDEIVE